MIIKQGDLFPPLDGIVRDINGNVVDVSGATVTFSMRAARSPATIKVIAAAATVTDGPNGKVQYQWAGSDTDAAGTYEGEFRVTPVSGLPMRVPTDGWIPVIIEEQVG